MPAPRFRRALLTELRERAGLTRTELARRVGVASGERIGSWERGIDQPSAPYLPRLAQALGVEPIELLDLDAEAPTFTALRYVAGLTIEDLAKAVGVRYGVMQRIDRGVVEPRDDLAKRLAAALGVKTAQVVAAHRRQTENP